MSPENSTHSPYSPTPRHVVREDTIEYGFIGKLQGLKYEYRADIRDRAALEKNFREKFQQLNRVNLTDSEFARLLDEIVTPDVFATAKTLRTMNSFTRVGVACAGNRRCAANIMAMRATRRRTRTNQNRVRGIQRRRGARLVVAAV